MVGVWVGALLNTSLEGEAIYIYICVCMYVCIYIERERERKREKVTCVGGIGTSFLTPSLSGTMPLTRWSKGIHSECSCT